MARDLSRALAVAIAAAREAGELLRSDLHRPGGPRGEVDKADADTEAEQLIRARLLGEFPGASFVGEETGRVAGHAGEPLWLVDANDDTRDYLRGRRGSAVSISLLVECGERCGQGNNLQGSPSRDNSVFWVRAAKEGNGSVRNSRCEMTR